MARTLDLLKHPRRLEIDFCLANHAAPEDIADTFDIDPRTVIRYRRAMLAADKGYFDKHRFALSDPGDGNVIEDAKRYAADIRRKVLADAESVFAPSN